jgi:DNA-binding LacI/PurR family transcriptional regulator
MPPAQRHPTLADVAERAGVSASTVSRTLRGLSTVSPDVRARVEKAAREMNFVVSRQASSLVTGKTGVVAALVPTLNSWFIGSALSSLGPVLRESGLELLVYVTPDMGERSTFFERLPARRNADALLVFSFDLSKEESARLDDLNMPVIYISQHAEGRPSVYVDDVWGAHRATQHLLNLGHRRIAFVKTIGASGFTFSSHERLIGYHRALDEAGIAPDEDLVVDTQVADKRGTMEAIGQLLSLREPPTAIFAEQDEVAVSVMWTLRQSNVDVPERMSVVGFDDHQMAEWSDLTTIAQSPSDIGRAAAGLALSLINEPAADQTRHVVLPTRLIPRGSTAPAPTQAADADAAGEGRE